MIQELKVDLQGPEIAIVNGITAKEMRRGPFVSSMDQIIRVLGLRSPSFGRSPEQRPAPRGWIA
jgi:hypothetical protein